MRFRGFSCVYWKVFELLIVWGKVGRMSMELFVISLGFWGFLVVMVFFLLMNGSSKFNVRFREVVWMG